MHRSLCTFFVLLASTAGCHRYEKVNDLQSAVGSRGRIVLTPEARGTNARRLGGVATEIEGTFVGSSSDSVGMRADVVRFSDLGTVPFAGGELRFSVKDVSSVYREELNRKKTTITAVLFTLGVLLLGAAVTVANTGGGSNGGGTVIPK